MRPERKIRGLDSPATWNQVRENYIRSWSELVSLLPVDLNPHNRKFVRDYFRAQLRIARSQKTKALRIFEGLDKRTGYKEFEVQHQPLLAAIDLAVRGENRRRVEPLFEMKKIKI